MQKNRKKKKIHRRISRIFSPREKKFSSQTDQQHPKEKKRKEGRYIYITTLSKYFAKQRKIKKCATWSFGDRVLRIVGVASEIAQHVVPSNRYSPGNIHGARDKHSYQIPSPMLYIMHIHQTVLSQKKKRKKKNKSSNSSSNTVLNFETGIKSRREATLRYSYEFVKIVQEKVFSERSDPSINSFNLLKRREK